MQAAVAWADGSLFKRNEESPLVDDMKRFGAPEDLLEETILEASPVIEIWPENFDVFQLFLSLSSQWVIIPGMAAVLRVGLRYESVEAVMRIKRLKNRSGLFDDLQVMEFAALEVLNKGGA